LLEQARHERQPEPVVIVIIIIIIIIIIMARRALTERERNGTNLPDPESVLLFALTHNATRTTLLTLTAPPTQETDPP
jgi:hypothetical protein